MLQPICPYLSERMLEELGLKFDKTIPFSDFDKNFVVGIKSNIILRSETAIITASSKIIV